MPGAVLFAEQAGASSSLGQGDRSTATCKTATGPAGMRLTDASATSAVLPGARHAPLCACAPACCLAWPLSKQSRSHLPPTPPAAAGLPAHHCVHF